MAVGLRARRLCKRLDTNNFSQDHVAYSYAGIQFKLFLGKAKQVLI